MFPGTFASGGDVDVDDVGVSIPGWTTILAGESAYRVNSLRVCNRSWRTRASWRANGRLHSLHVNGRDPVWLRSCLLRCSPFEKALWQTLHSIPQDLRGAFDTIYCPHQSPSQRLVILGQVSASSFDKAHTMNQSTVEEAVR